MSGRKYPEPNFYIISDKLHYTIRGEVELKEEIDGACLQQAVDTAFTRFPYFSVQVVIKDNAWNLDSNPRPHNIIHSPDAVTLGTAGVNFHLVVISYYGKSIFFNVSHSITDGAGRAPLTKAVVYYYLKYRYPDIVLDPEGIYLAEEEPFADECVMPVDKEELMNAEPTYFRKAGKAFKLSEKELITDHTQTEYRFRIDEKDFMKLNKDSDASPSILVSAMLAEMTWKKHPDIEENIVIDLCMNMRSGLGNLHSHLPLFTSIPLVCVPSMKAFGLEELCTSLRGMVILQSQDENVRFLYKQTLLGVEALQKIPDMKERQKLVTEAVYHEDGPLASTFISSYVGKSSLGCLAPYVSAIFTTVDAIPDGGVIVEVTNAGGYFYFTFMQDFSTDVYVRTFTELLEERGLTVEMLGSRPILAPDIRLPEIKTE